MTVLNDPTLEMKPKLSSVGVTRKKVQLKETLNFSPRPVWASRLEDISGQALEKYLAGVRNPGSLVDLSAN